MDADWQTLVAAGVVSATVLIFVVRLARRKNKPGCGKDCGCEKK